MPIDGDPDDPPWNPAKREANLRRHGADFVDAGQVFEDDGYIEDEEPDSLRIHGEERWRVIGMVRGMVLFVVCTERDNTNWYILARRAKPAEERRYAQARRKDAWPY